MSYAAALAAVRRSCTIRSSVRATITPPTLPVAGRLPGLRLEPGVELGGVLHQPGAALRRPQRADQPGRVPRRPARQACPARAAARRSSPAWSGGRPRSEPITPPPMITTRARAGQRQPPAHLVQQALEARVRGTSRRPSRSAPCPHGVEVEVEGARGGLDGAPQRPAVLASTSDCRRTRASRSRRRTSPKYAATSASTWSSSRSHSVAVLPSSKQASLLPEYS